MPAKTQQKKIKKMPELRFLEFGDEWEKKNLGDVVELRAREVLKPKKPYLAIGIRSHFKGTFQKPNSDPSKIAMDTLFEVKENDLITNITFAWEGAMAIVKKGDEGGLVSHRFPTYVFKKNVLDVGYFSNIFPTKRMRYILKTISPGGAGRNRVLKRTDFLKIEFLFPSLPEQQKIAEFLGGVDEWIENLKEQKAKLKEYKKGMMQKIFSQEVRFKDDDGNDFPDWEEEKLGQIATFSKGTALSKADIKDDGINKCIHYGELFTIYSELITEVHSRTNIELSTSRLSEKNDILMPTSDVTPNGLATASALSEEGVILGGDVLVIRSKILNNLFFAYHVYAHKKDVMRLVQGVTVYHLYGSHLSEMRVKYPSQKEQQKIADFFSSLDELDEAKAKEAERAEQWKKGLMQNMFI